MTKDAMALSNLAAVVRQITLSFKFNDGDFCGLSSLSYIFSVLRTFENATSETGVILVVAPPEQVLHPTHTVGIYQSTKQHILATLCSLLGRVGGGTGK